MRTRGLLQQDVPGGALSKAQGCVQESARGGAGGGRAGLRQGRQRHRAEAAAAVAAAPAAALEAAAALAAAAAAFEAAALAVAVVSESSSGRLELWRQISALASQAAAAAAAAAQAAWNNSSRPHSAKPCVDLVSRVPPGFPRFVPLLPGRGRFGFRTGS